MPISMGGRIFADEFDYAISQLSPPGQLESNTVIKDEDRNIPRITVTPKESESMAGTLRPWSWENPKAPSTHENLKAWESDMETRPSWENEKLGLPLERAPTFRPTPKFDAEGPVEDNSEYPQKQFEQNQAQEAFDVAAYRIARQMKERPEREMPIANAVARIGIGLVNLAAFPGKVYQGEINLDTPEGKEEATKWASEMSLTMVMAPAPIAAKVTDGTLGSIAGVRAQNLNKEALKIAEEMHAVGSPPDLIWKRTGFYKGSDGKWRHELPSEELKFKRFEPNKPQTLENIIEYPSLFAAYPELRNVKFVIDNKYKYIASYSENTLTLNLTKAREGGWDTKDIILHEIQHKIQEIEKFHRGSNPETEVKNFIKNLQVYKQTMLSAGKIQEAIEANNLLYRASRVKENIGQNLYQKVPGEIEARTVELRKRLPTETKKQVSPEESAKYFGDELIGAPSSQGPAASNVTQFRRAANDNKTYEQLQAEFEKVWNQIPEAKGEQLKVLEKKRDTLMNQLLGIINRSADK